MRVVPVSTLVKDWECGCFPGERCTNVCLGETQALVNGSAEKSLYFVLGFFAATFAAFSFVMWWFL